MTRTERKGANSVKALDILESSSAIAETMSSAKRMQEVFGSSSAIAEALRSTTRMQEILGSSSAIAETMSSAKRMQEVLGSSSVIAEALRSTTRMQEILGSSSAIAQAMSSAKRMQEMLGSGSAIDSAKEFFKSLGESSALTLSLIALSRPANFSSAIGVIERELAHEDYVPTGELNPGVVDSSLTSIAAAENAESFATLFARVPYALQLIVVFAFWQIILPQLNSISANLITPYAKDYISDESLSEQDKVGALKKLDFDDLDLPSDELRFISGSDVRLRSEPSVKSETLDLLRLGQIVVFVEKERNWTKVLVQYEEGEVVSGWVFTRYVAKFNKRSKQTH